MNPERKRRYKERRALPSIRPHKILQETLLQRLQIIHQLLDKSQSLDIENLAEIASLVSKVERILALSYEVPCPPYEDTDGYFQCRFSACRGKYKLKKASHFNDHLATHHAFLSGTLRHKKCLSCNEEFGTTNGLIGHERTRHHCNYKSRSELVIPYFRNFESTGSCLEFLRNRVAPSVLPLHGVQPAVNSDIGSQQISESDDYSRQDHKRIRGTNEGVKYTTHPATQNYDLFGDLGNSYPAISCSDELDFLCEFEPIPTVPPLPGINCTDNPGIPPPFQSDSPRDESHQVHYERVSFPD